MAQEILSEEEKKARREHGIFACSVLVGVSFTSLLTIIGAELSGDLVRRATFLFCFSIPSLVAYVLVGKQPRRYITSRVLRSLPMIGVLTTMLGLSFLVESHIPGAGWFLGIFSFLVGAILGEAETRAERKRKGSVTRGRLAVVTRPLKRLVLGRRPQELPIAPVGNRMVNHSCDSSSPLSQTVDA